MASVSAQAVGGKLTIVENVTTIGEVKAKLNLAAYSASINGEPADNDDVVSDNDFVSLAPQVKGA